MIKRVFLIPVIFLVVTNITHCQILNIPDFKMTGYACMDDSTKGGDGVTIDTISTLEELQIWALDREDAVNPELIYIKGKITSATTSVITIKHGANISIFGMDSAAELENVGLNIWDYQNVIIKNLKIHEILYPDDAITISECRYVWVDHCELYSRIGPGIGVDTYDGLLDIKKGSKNVTVSWCYLHDHMKVSLIGHTDDESQAATDSLMTITMHHNYFSNNDGRNPSLRFGKVHFYNNYLENISDYGFAIRKRAHALIENNHYHNVSIPIATDKFDDVLTDQGFACIHNNIYTGTCSENDNSITRIDCNYWNTLPYSYTLEDVSTVSETVKQYAGKFDHILPNDTGEITSVRQGENNFNIGKIFPNPVILSATISFSLPNTGKVQIILYDLYGRNIRTLTDKIYNKGENSLNINKNDLPEGLYFFVLNFEGSRTIQKVLIQ